MKMKEHLSFSHHRALGAMGGHELHCSHDGNTLCWRFHTALGGSVLSVSTWMSNYFKRARSGGSLQTSWGDIDGVPCAVGAIPAISGDASASSRRRW